MIVSKLSLMASKNWLGSHVSIVHWQLSQVWTSIKDDEPCKNSLATSKLIRTDYWLEGQIRIDYWLAIKNWLLWVMREFTSKSNKNDMLLSLRVKKVAS